MYVQASGHASRFADRVAQMLERVEHRAGQLARPTAKRPIGFDMKPT